MFVFELQAYGAVLTRGDLAKVVAAFDRAGNGTVHFHDFCSALRGGMNKRRTELVRLAFDKLDRNENGRVDVDDVRGYYDASEHPRCKSGEATVEEVLEAFLSAFEGDESPPDGVVTWGEWEAYHAGVSASIDSDDYFRLWMDGTWHLEDQTRLPPRPRQTAAAPAEQRHTTPQQRSKVAHIPNTTRHFTSMEGVTVTNKSPAPAKRIVGYTGHIPCAQETFGDSFAKVEQRATLPPKGAALPPPPFKDEATAFFRKGNAANNHSFRLE